MQKDIQNEISNKNLWYTCDQHSYAKQKGAYWRIKERRVFIKEVISNYQRANKDKKCFVLDAGCGDGVNLMVLQKMENLKIFGIDNNPLRVSRAKALFPNFNIKESDILRTDFNQEMFDIVILSHVLEHIEDDRGAIDEIKRILKPGGILILLIPNEGCFLAQLRNKYLERSIMKNTDHVHFYTAGKIVRLAGEKNLKILDIKPMGFFVPHQICNIIFDQFKIGYSLLNLIGRILPSQASELFCCLTK